MNLRSKKLERFVKSSKNLPVFRKTPWKIESAAALLCVERAGLAGERVTPHRSSTTRITQIVNVIYNQVPLEDQICHCSHRTASKSIRVYITASSLTASNLPTFPRLIKPNFSLQERGLMEGESPVKVGPLSTPYIPPILLCIISSNWESFNRFPGTAVPGTTCLDSATFGPASGSLVHELDSDFDWFRSV